MEKHNLIALDQQLQKIEKDFTANYNHGIHGPYGTNKAIREISKKNYEYAISAAAAICYESKVYEFIKEKGQDLTHLNRITHLSKPQGFLYDIKGLIDVIRKIAYQ